MTSGIGGGTETDPSAEQIIFAVECALQGKCPDGLRGLVLKALAARDEEIERLRGEAVVKAAADARVMGLRATLDEARARVAKLEAALRAGWGDVVHTECERFNVPCPHGEACNLFRAAFPKVKP